MSADRLPGLVAIPAHHPKHGPVTRLCWRGWQVDCTAVSVSVPQQSSAEKSIDDLAELLDAAHRMLSIAVPRRARHLAALRAGVPDSVRAAAIAILREVQRTSSVGPARRRSTDIYASLSHAWRDAGMPVPYALLVGALRAALPTPGGSLADFGATASPAALQLLYDRAITLCSAQPRLGDTRIA